MANGENIIYHYIQKTLIGNDEPDSFTKQLLERLIIDLSIWIPKSVYDQLPVLIPYVIRDSSCRKKQPDTGKHEWGFANSEGFLRDDNSLIKGIIKPLFVDGNRVKDYNGKKLANGFVASHIWRKLQKEETRLASTLPTTNSFIPNLVWLPKQISKLTDREGSYAQNLLKTLSYKIYFEDHSPSSFQTNIWSYLDNPNMKLTSFTNSSEMNYFRTPQSWVDKKKKDLKNDIKRILTTLESNVPEAKKVKCSSYLPSLVERIDPDRKNSFIEWLNDCNDSIH